MSNAITELVFILDRSGSMAGLERDTIGGFNDLLDRQRREPGECRLTTVLFDDQYELLHDRVDIRKVAPIGTRDYCVRGSTALLDALGRTINRVVQAQRHAPVNRRADKVMFVIITDGMENSSCEFDIATIRDMIEKEKRDYGWEFLFLGANMDAVSTAASYGIDADRAVDYRADSEGTRLNYEVLSEALSDVRACRPMADGAWKERIEQDVRRRGRRR